AARSASPRFARRAATALALLGLVVSGALQVLHVRTYLVPSASSFCAVGETFDCNAVTLSRFSVLLGVPLPIWGALGFYALSLMAWRGARLLLPLSAFAAVASLALFAEELLHVGAVCMFCEAVHVIALALFVLVFVQRDRLVANTRQDYYAALALPAALWLGVRLFTPAYWTSVLWTRELPFATGVDERGFPWIGATEPSVTLHEYTDYACPHCMIAAARSHRRLAAHPDELRIVRHQQPRMRCLARAMRACELVRLAICAGDQGKFWQADSWLFARGAVQKQLDVAAAAQELELDAHALAACIDDPATQERAAVFADEARARKVRGTPGYVVDDGDLLDPEQAGAVLDERL
ncbi:MAG: thioredoxin domain-containing protein, partial [Deltaproteobacteria bacterium]|nr:thioredoxin domain-containing protein [Nannocystaceae bacterium]